MIIQIKETKSQSSLIDLLGGNTKNSSSKSNDLFSKLLSSFGMQAKTDEAKIVKSTDFKAVIDPKNAAVKNADSKSANIKELQSLLTGAEEKDSKLVSSELLGNLSNDQVRTLINRAKEYLKNEITAKSPEYQTDQKSLPKTLGGLVKLAEKLGLEPQSISLSTLIKEPEEQASFSLELLSKPLLETKAIASLPATAIDDKAPIEVITQLLSSLKNKEQKASDASSKEDSAQKVSEKSETQPLRALLQNLEKHEADNGSITNTDKTDPIKISPSGANAKADALIALLQGSDETKESKAETSASQKIEGESSKGSHALKADSLEVKSKEAAQSMRYFASDLKEAVQEYKPPFTRLTMKLNPEKLGEVEVTLVQRGNNVHVNIQSNNTNSVAFLAHNATELKAQLASQGITNATMNFMSGGDSQSNQQQGQQQQGQQQRFKAYESFEDLKLNEEQLSALEIIIPHYA
ncbi:flagellar hook-length control protein FliK [Sulfuricurvum sp.]|uniref:flagellar hook-length control protein FliK n=1 Tax=Sulfuricurvum sp. TaxID=2025608 RepID=UPI002E32CA11|nr:flagellar hook-length control protein FliK [Sulfuricurvum sp.]HEX5330824.1 flagellar hook-length control protein FliK [Sulfuricurvum sp.]